MIQKSTHGHHHPKRLLRNARRKEDGYAGRDPQGFPQSCAQIPPRRKSQRQACRGEIQGDLRGERHSLDEKKRKIYDQVGFYSDQIDPAQAEAYARQQRSGGQARGGSYGQPPVDFGGFDFSGFQSDPGAQAGAGSANWGNFKDIFSGIFSGAQQQQQPRGPQPGSDIEYQATVDFWTAIRGGQARIQINRQEVCPTCHGQASTGGATVP